MGINISAGGKGLAAILGVGAILLAALGKIEWIFFLIAAVAVYFSSLALRYS